MLKPAQTRKALVRPWEEGLPLLDAITIDHGPRQILGRFFLLAAAALRGAGVSVRVHSDMTSLSEVNAEIPEAHDHLHPAFDTHYGPLPPETSFWMSVHAPGGRMVGRSACKMLCTSAAGLTGEFESLRLFYRDPAPYAAKGTTCRVLGNARAIADGIKGKVTYGGGHWIHPDFRRLGIAQVMARLIRALGYTRWGTTHTVGITAIDLAALGRLLPYGYRNSDQTIYLSGTFGGDYQLNLIWMHNDWLVADLADYAERAEAKTARVTDADVTMVPVAPVHGRMRRS